MKIRPDVEVHPHKEYCEDPMTSGICDYPIVKDKKSFCSLYLEYIESEDGVILKCDQCKADYLKAQREEHKKFAGKFYGNDVFICMENENRLDELTVLPVSELHDLNEAAEQLDMLNDQ